MLVCVATLEPVPAAVEIVLIFRVKITVCAIVETCVETTLLRPMKSPVRVLRDVLVVITTGRKLLTADDRSAIAARAPDWELARIPVIVDCCVETTLLRPTKLPVKLLKPVELTVARPKAVDAVVEIPGMDAVSSVSPVMLLTDVETTLLTP